MKPIIAVFLFLSLLAIGNAQQSKRVLFVGNSYTYVNDLPQMIADMASSSGDQLTHTSSTPGGCTFQQHCVNNSIQLIRQGGWDAVVLQEQSQYPSFPQEQVEAEVFPYAALLVDAVYTASPCAEPIFYMTWGRRDGDEMNADEYPVLGTYEGMDSMLCVRYTEMAADNDASLCPVGRVWRLLRSEHPEIDLYAADGSHPSLAGTYAAACAFYALLFHHDPAGLSFSAGLDDNVARTIRSAASQIVWSSASSSPQSQWTRPLPVSSFQPVGNSDPQLFVNSSSHADSLLWSFGDGSSLNTANDVDSVFHSYSDTGHFTVTLIASRHCIHDTSAIVLILSSSDTTNTDTTAVDSLGIVYAVPSRNHQISVFPTIASEAVTIQSSAPTPIDAAIISTAGQTLMRQYFLGKCQLDITSLPKGLYFLVIRQGDSMITEKILKR